MKARSIEDIAFINAVGRPGCSKKERQEFLSRRDGISPPVPPHPLLREILAHTYGISIYEEDLLHLAQHVAGWDLSEADGLRKVTKLKEKGAELANELEKKFINDCIERRDLSLRDATYIWEKVVLPYSKYGFNKSVTKTTKVFTAKGSKEIQEITPGDRVLTIDEEGKIITSEVLALHDHGEVPLWEVEFDNGIKEKCTLDHKWLTEHGQQPLWRILEEELETFGYSPDAASRPLRMQGVRSEIREVFSQKEASQSVRGISETTKNKGCGFGAYKESSLWDRAADDHKATEGASRRMREVQDDAYRDKENYKNQVKPVSVYAEEGFRNCKEDLGTKGYTIRGSGKIAPVERSQSRKVCRDTGQSARITEAFQDGSLVRTIYEILGFREEQEDAMRISSKAGRLYQQGEGDSDRSRWTMAFSTSSWRRGVEEGAETGSSVGERSVEKAELDLDPVRYGQLQILWRTYRDLLRQPFRDDKVQVTRNLQSRKVVRLTYVGFEQAYDLEVSHPSHNFVLSSGLCSSNSHAVAYSILGYQTAYYKYYARAPFFAAVLNSKLRGAKDKDGEEKNNNIKNDAKKFGVCIDVCDINKSKQYYVAIEPKRMVTGLGAIKGLGDKVLDQIIARQPYDSFEDFLRKNLRKVTKTHAGALAKAGAFDVLNISRKFVHDHFVTFKEEYKKHIKKMDDDMFQAGDRDFPLPETMEKFVYSVNESRKLDWNLQEKLYYEKEVLGEYVSGSAKDVFPGFFRGGKFNISLNDIKIKNNRSEVGMEGVITGVREIVIKKKGKNQGRTMAKLTVVNLIEEIIEVTVWPDSYEIYKDIFKKGGDTPIRGMFTINEWAGEKSLIMTNKVKIFERE
jgi:hypothetical protein